MTISDRPKWLDITGKGDEGRLFKGDVLLTSGDAIGLEGDILVNRSPLRVHEVQPDRRMLLDFATLADQPDEKVLGYARRWGLLGLCSHRLRSGLHPARVRAGLLTWRTVSVSEPCTSLGGEPLSAWRYWSTQAMTLLRVSSRVRRGEVVSTTDWETLARSGPWADVLTSPTPSSGLEYWHEPDRRTFERILLADALDAWQTLAGARLRLSWWATEPHLRLGGGGLLGALGIHLLLVATDVDGVAFCECGRPHMPRRPRATQWRSYCEDCRDRGVPVTLASRRYRQREKADPQRTKLMRGRRVGQVG